MNNYHDQKQVFLALHARVVFEKKQKWYIPEGKICPISKDVLHWGCENVLKVFLECFSLGQSTSLASKIILKIFKGQNLCFRLKDSQKR